MFGATAATTSPITKTATEVRKTGKGPLRSARRPAATIESMLANVYAASATP